MKSIVMEGSIEKAPCAHCQRFVQATYSYGPVELELNLVVEDVMRATCNQCGAVVATAPQSAHRFKSALQDREDRRTTIRLPQDLHDFVSLNLSAAGAEASHFELYFRALLLACRGREEELGGAIGEVDDEVLHRPLRVTVNLNLRQHLGQVLSKLQVASKIKNVSELIRRLLVLGDGLLSQDVAHETQRLTYAYA